MTSVKTIKKTSNSNFDKTAKKTQNDLNVSTVFKTIIEVFDKNSLQSMLSLIETYLKSVNKSAFSKKVGISRATLYDMLSGKKNPTLRIFVQCVHEILLDLGFKSPSSSKLKKTDTPSSLEKIAKSKKLLLDSVLDVFKKNKIQPMLDIIRAYLKSKNKSSFAQDVGISRATLYDMLNGKKNPTLRIFMQCVDVMIDKRSRKDR